MLFFAMRRLRNTLLSTPASTDSSESRTDPEKKETTEKTTAGDIVHIPHARKSSQQFSEGEPGKRHSQA